MGLVRDERITWPEVLAVPSNCTTWSAMLGATFL